MGFLNDQLTARTITGNFPNDGYNSIIDDETSSQVPAADISDLDDSIMSDNSQPVNNAEVVMASTSVRTATNSCWNENRELTPKCGRKTAVMRTMENDDIVGQALIRIEENKLKLLEKQDKKASDEDESFFEILLPHLRLLTSQKNCY